MLGKRKRGGVSKKILLILGGIFLCICFLSYLVFFSGVFRVARIEIEGIKKGGEDTIRSMVERELASPRRPFPAENIFLFDSEGVAGDLAAAFSRIQEIKIVKHLPDTIRVVIEEREMAGIWCHRIDPQVPIRTESISDEEDEVTSENSGEETKTPGECFYIDEEGVIFEAAPASTGSLLLRLEDHVTEDYALGKPVLDSTTLLFAKEVRDLFSKSDILPGIDYVIVTPSSEIEIRIREGWSIYADTSLVDPEKLSLIIKNALLGDLRERRETLEYIDLRIPRRLYYR